MRAQLPLILSPLQIRATRNALCWSEAGGLNSALSFEEGHVEAARHFLALEHFGLIWIIASGRGVVGTVGRREEIDDGVDGFPVRGDGPLGLRPHHRLRRCFRGD